jgi:tetratricopeptide (TPR) repeat protein
VTTSAQRAARSALDAGRPALERLDRTHDSEDVAAALIESWEAVEQALRALAGSTALAGQALVHELRQRNMLSLNDAHTLVDFGAAADRARVPQYVPTAADAATARTAFEQLHSIVERDESTRPAHTGPLSPPPASLDVPAPRSNLLGRIIAVVAVLAVAGAGVYYAFIRDREPADLLRGRQAYAAGDRLMAKTAFAAAAGSDPALAEPHIYLGRMAREEGDMPTASAELRRAVELEPENAVAHRELAGFLLATGRPDLARTFYDRALRIDPTDRNAMGYMGCTLMQLGRPDLAQRFLQRAGGGPWQQCVQILPAPAPPQK